MIRLLMASTAVAAILATSTLAQDASSSSAMDTSSSAMTSSSMSAPAGDTSSSAQGGTSSMASSMMDSSAMSSQMTDASSMDSSMMSSAATDTTTAAPAPRQQVQILSGYTRADSDNLATKIIGRPVYDGTGTDANNLGNVTDLVVNENGEVSAVILGVGGFLGLGQKQVAVDFQALKWVVAADNTERYVLQTTKDELTQAPDFQAVDDQPADKNNASANDLDNQNASSTLQNGGGQGASSAPADNAMSSSSAAQ